MMKIKLSIAMLLLSPQLLAKFTDELASSGIDFKHENGMTGKFYMPEILGSGTAFFDFQSVRLVVAKSVKLTCCQILCVETNNLLDVSYLYFKDQSLNSKLAIARVYLVLQLS